MGGTQTHGHAHIHAPYFNQPKKMSYTHSDSDWDSHATVMQKKRTAAQSRSSAVVNAARRTGAAVETTKKYSGGTNKKQGTDKNSMHLDNDTESTQVKKVEASVGKLIMKARNAKGLSQKELATKIQEKPQVVNEYESGKAIPNNQIMNKLERALGIKLRGKNAGLALGGPKK